MQRINLSISEEDYTWLQCNDYINPSGLFRQAILFLKNGGKFMKAFQDPDGVKKKMKAEIEERIEGMNLPLRLRIIIDDQKRVGINFNFGPSYPDDDIEDLLDLLKNLDFKTEIQSIGQAIKKRKTIYLTLRGKDKPHGMAYAKVQLILSDYKKPIVNFKSELV